MKGHSTVDVITFPNEKGNKLYGILHQPAEALKIGILILNPGVKNRVGPHRLYVKMAKAFCDMGFPVLRFDPHGIGDSEGCVEETMAADFYATVQLGRFVGDTSSAMDWMEMNLGTERFVLAGLCGGAITALHAGARDLRVGHIIGIGMPVRLDGSNVDPYQYMSNGQLKDIKKSYLDKLASGKAWLRFLSFRSEYRLILNSFEAFVRELFHSKLKGSKAEAQNGRAFIQNKNLNFLFPKLLQDFASCRRIQLIFSGADRLYWEFSEKYVNFYNQEYLNIASNLNIHVIENANHILSFPKWQKEMLDKIRVSLKELDIKGSYCDANPGEKP